MLSLSPAKLLVVLIIALIVLGPEKLPDVARQLGAMWGDVRKWRARVESEVRSTFPDLPPTHEVVQAVRSPLSFLDRLADHHERETSVDEVAGTSSGAETEERDIGAVSHTNGGRRPPADGRERGDETAPLGIGTSDERATSEGLNTLDSGEGPGPDTRRPSAKRREEPQWVYDDPSMN